MKQTLPTVLNALLCKISSLKKSSALLVMLLLLVSGNVVGQSMPYTFSQSSGSYTALTAPTNYQATSVLNTDAISASVALPFTFVYNGTSCNAIFINNNGYITLASSTNTAKATAATYNPIAASTAYVGAISGYGINLLASTVSGAAGSIDYMTLGTTPNRKFVVQYKDLARSVAGATIDRINFQIILNETTNVISIVYGTTTTTFAAITASSHGVVGLRGTTNTNWNARQVYGTAPYATWATSGGSGDNGSAPLQAVSTAGPAGINTMRLTSAVLPASGLTYTWTPVSTYNSLPYTQNFETWSSANAINDVPGVGIQTFPATGNLSPRAQNETVANSLWGSTNGSIVAMTTLPAAQGTKCARIHSFDAASGLKGYMDFYLNFSNVGSKTLTFDLLNTVSTRPVNVYLSTDGGITFGATLGTYSTTITSWTTYTLSVGSTTSTTTVLRFEFTTDFLGSSDVGIDNVNVSVVLPCVAPTSLVATPTSSAQTLTTISGSFAAAATPPTGYLVVRTTSNAQPTPTNGTTYTTGSNAIGNIDYVGTTAGSWTSTGLTAGNTYYYWVFSYNNTACTGPVYSTSATSFSQSTASCPTFAATIAINGATAVPGTSYPTITAAIADMQVCGITQSTILELTSGYANELVANTLTLPVISGISATNTITIRPAAGAIGKSISSSVAGPTIDINAGDYWIIDGRPGGTGSLDATNNLAIINTSTATAGSAIQIINDATYNKVQYCNLKASFGSTTSGVVFIRGGTTNVTGNDYNEITYNNINASATCFNGVFSIGITNTNNNCVISNNNIFDFFSASSVTNGVLVSSSNTDWTISGNSFYQTATRTYTTGVIHTAININNTSGNNFSILNNNIGGTAASLLGTALTMTGSSTRFVPISLSLGTTTASTVQGNTISNINLTSTSGASTTPGVFCGIYVAAGTVNIGTITGNIVGSLTGTSAITITSSTSGALSFGIASDAVSTVNILNNTIGSLIISGSVTTVSHSFIAINTAGALGNYFISNNTIGNTSTANSINVNTVSTSGNGQQLAGIVNSATGTITIANNTIANLNNANNSSGTTTFTPVTRGIVSSAGTTSITGNTVQNLTSGSFYTAAASVIGIQCSTTVAPAVVSNNIIYGLKNTNVAGTTVIGILFAGPTTGTNLVSKNLIYGLQTGSTTGAATTGTIGLNTSVGKASIQNNMIRLGIDTAGNAQTGANGCMGIYDASGTNDYYHNSVYIGGTGVTTGVVNTYAFNSAVTINTRNFQNNIFLNARSNSTTGGKHYAITVAGTTANPSGLTCNYNIYQATGAGGTFGYFNGIDVTSIAAWRTATGNDANSINADPCFNNPTATTPDLHLTNCNGAGSPAEAVGVTIAIVTDDIDGETRSSLSPNDIGADAGSYGAVGSEMGATALVSPTQMGCKTGTETVIVRIKNNSANAIDFSLDPVTVNASCSLGSYASSTIVNSGTLAAGATQDVTMDATIDMTTNGTYTFNAYTSVTGDVNTTNDAMTAVARTVNSLGGTYTVGATGSYTSITAAVAAANSATCITAPVIFSLIDANYTTATNETFPITINANSQFTSINTLTIKPASGVTTSISGSSASAIIRINAADYVTIDGSNDSISNSVCPKTTATRNLSISNTNIGSVSTAVVWLQSSGTDGATNNKIQNCNITGNSITTTVFGIGSADSALSTSNANGGKNSINNQFINNNVSKVQYGIYSVGESTTNRTSGTVINLNTITTVGLGGIFVGYENGTQIKANSISNVIGAGDKCGVCVGILSTSATTTTTTSECVNTVIDGNTIYNIIEAGTNSAVGLNIGSASSGTYTIINNMISGILANGTAADYAAGIQVSGGAAIYNVYHNTIAMNGTITGSTAATQASVCLAVTNATMPTLNLKNNIFSNIQLGNASATTKFACIGTTGTSFTGLTSNNNVFYCAGSGPGTYQIGVTGGIVSGTVRNAFADWKTATSKDANSINVQPIFTSTADLHLNVNSNDILNTTGASDTGITNDFDCATRDSSTPDIGADEFTPSPAFTLSASTATICNGTPSLAITITSGASDYDTFSWTNSTTVSGNPTNGWTFNPATTTTYTLTASNSGNSNSRTVTVVVTVNAVPSPITFTSSNTTICNGNVQSIVASGGTISSSGNATLGTGTTLNTASTYPSPYTNLYGGVKHQMLIRASELTALGFVTGTQISTIKFNVSTVGASFSGSLANFQIDMKNTSSTVLTSTTFESGLTTVFGPTTQAIPITGLPATVTHTLATQFTWDGTSSIVIQTSYSNGNSGNTATAVLMTQSDPGFVSTNWYRVDSSTAAVVLAAATPTASGNARPNMIFGFTSPIQSPISWNNTDSLFLNIGATTAYSGNPRTVYAKPSDTTTYTATATAANGCTKSNTIEIAVNPLPTALILTGSAACSGSTGTITSSTSVSGVTYQLYNSSNVAVGSAIAGTDSGLTWSSIAIGTGYYVKATNATTTCVSANSNVVAVDSNPNPTALVLTGSAVCAGSTGSITSSTSVSGINYQLYDSSNVTVGSAIAGTDSGLTWSSIAIGTGYYVKATNATTTCVSANSNAVAMGTNPNPTALVLTGSSTCAGTTGAITSSSSVSGVNYQLYDSSNGTVGSAIAGTDSGLTWSSIAIGTGYYVKATNATTTCVSANSNAVAITTVTDKTWIGTTDNSWNTASNWSCGILPSSTDVIIISSGSPILDTNFTVGSTGSLTISASGTLTINSAKTLTISGTADFGDQSVTIKSDLNGTGAIGRIAGTLTRATNVTVERYIPAKRAWRALTSPLKGADLSIFSQWQNNGSAVSNTGVELWGPGGTGSAGNGLEVGPNNSILQYASGAWAAVTNTKTTNLFTTTTNKAFFVFPTGGYGSNLISSSAIPLATTLKATGQLIIGDVPYQIPSTSHTLIGNPYASPISPLALLTANTTFDNNLWIWDPNVAGDLNVGAYNLFTKTGVSTGTYTNTSGSSYSLNPTPDIQSGQAFFVKAVSGTQTLTISESFKTATVSSNAIFRDAAPAELLRLSLYKQESSSWSGRDGAIALFFAEAQANQIPNKMTNGSENVAFTKNGALFASEHHLPLVASDVLNVRVWNTTAGANYKLKINTEQFTTTNLNATLEDSFTNSRTPLTLNGTAVEYPFSVTTEATSTGNRFRIVFETNALGIINPKASGISIVPNPVTGDTFQVNLGTLGMGMYSYSICNALGQEVENGSINNVAQNTNYSVKFKNNTAAGIYIMKVTGTDNTVFTAKIIKK